MSHSTAIETNSPSTPSFAQSITAITLGVAFWLLAALLIRFGGPAGLLTGLPRLVTFALTIPVTWRSIDLVRRTVRPAPDGLLLAVLIVTIAALMCDVIALTWFPALYALEPRDVISGVVLILWAVGWALALVVWRTTKS